jgi:hypothetical protein
MEQHVQTVVGVLPMSQLRYEVKEYKEPNVIILAREWYYTGSDPAVLMRVAAMESEFIKRDVWPTILCGHSIAAEV